MIKLEAHTFHNKNVMTPAQLSNKSPIDIVRQKKIIFKRELLNTEQNFLVQIEENQEIVYLKPDVPDLIITDLTNMAIQEDIPEYQALEYHNRAAKLLEFYTQNQIQVQYTSVLFSKINYAIILKKYAVQNEALEILLDCDEILKIKGKVLKKNSNESLNLAQIIQNKLLRLRLMFQVTLLFSETKKNKQALDMAKKALRILKSIIQNTIKLCQQITVMSLINKKQRANSEISSPLQKIQSSQSINLPFQQSQILSYPQIVENVFKEILISITSMLPNDEKSNDVITIQNFMIRNNQNRSQSLFASEYVFQPQNNQQNKLFTIIDDNHPMLQMQILGLMQLTYVDLEELFPINSYEMVMAEEVILELIMLTGLSFYSISTELRFINNQSSKLTVEIWLGKAIEIFYTYVPHSSAIFNQIYQVYQKLYGVDKQSIPEDEEVEYHTKLLKPHPFNNKSTLSNKIVIIIKVPNQNKQSQSKDTETKQSQNTQTNQQKIQQSIFIKKQILLPQKHTFTQPNSDKKFDTMQDEKDKSPQLQQLQQQLFIKKNNNSLNSTDVKQRVEILMNQILNQQARLTQEKLKQKNTPITILKQKYQVTSKIQENQNTFNPLMTSQLKTTIPVSRSLSNSRKTSQTNFKNQFNSVKTAQMRYRTQMSSGDESSKQLAQQIAAQLASFNRQSTKAFQLKRSDSAKKQKSQFQQN